MLTVGLLPFFAIYLSLEQTVDSFAEDEDSGHKILVFSVFQWMAYLVLTVELSIVTTYVLLCYEDYRWWWNSFMIGSSPGLYFTFFAIPLSIHFNSLALFLACSFIGLSVGLVGGSVACLCSF